MISACMAISVRELRTAVREWACCQLGTYATWLSSIAYSQTCLKQAVKG